MLDRDAFLRQEVESATPAKLRWMLIRKAIGHCHSIEQYWKNEDWHSGMEWLIAVQDILNELLAGITDKQNVFAKQIADVYIFLLKEAFEAGRDRNLNKIRNVREVLEVDLETWRLFVERELAANAPDVKEVSHPGHGSPIGNATFMAFTPTESPSVSLNFQA